MSVSNPIQNPKVGDKITLLDSDAINNEKNFFFSKGNVCVVTAISGEIYSARWVDDDEDKPELIEVTRDQFTFNGDQHQLV